jgi:hypothetical protein
MSSNQTRGFALKRLHALPLLLGMLLTSSATLVNAQSDAEKSAMPMTREQVKMERDEFLKTHRWDTDAENWVLRANVDPPKGMKSRAEMKADRDEFLRMHRYEQNSDSWVPMKETPRNLSTMSRAQIKEETRQFLRMHHWDFATDTWVENESRKKK